MRIRTVIGKHAVATYSFEHPEGYVLYNTDVLYHHHIHPGLVKSAQEKTELDAVLRHISFSLEYRSVP